MTLLEALQWAEQELKSTLHEKTHAVHAPNFDTQILLAHVLQKSSAYIVSHFSDELKTEKEKQFKQFVERRKQHEPIAYILERKAFYGRDFFVNENVLIPRPETEHLIEEALRRMRDDSVLLDIGTGSGAIAVTIAKETGNPVIAIDVSVPALEVALKNAQTHGVAGKISFLRGSLLEPYIGANITSQEPHGIIFANLPYLRTAQWEFLDPDVKQYEPKLALTAGVDGLDLYDELLQQVKNHRKMFPKTLDILMEIDPSQELSLPRLIKEHLPNAQIEMLYDLENRPRICIVRT